MQEDSLILNITEEYSNNNNNKKKNKKLKQNDDDDYDFEDFHKKELKKFNKNSSLAKTNKYKSEVNYKKNDNEEHKPIVSSLFRNNPEIPKIDLVQVKSVNEKVFSSKTFSDLDLHPFLVASLKERFNIEKTTAVQQKSIPILLNGSDALIKSVTGSGKTLAYAIPIIQDLQSIEPKINRSDGIHAVVVTPTRELALQTFEYFLYLLRSFTRIVPGILVGGEKKKSEKARIRKGINILVTTPGRFLDHVEHTTNLQLDKVKWFIIDEADRLFEQGFEEAIKKIVDNLKEQSRTRIQTVLLSATLTKDVKRLAGLALIEPCIIDMSDNDMKKDNNYTLPKKLKHHYMIVAAKLRMITLLSFIIDKCLNDKCIKFLIFMSTQDVVDFYFTLFVNVINPLLTKSGLNEIGFFSLHGNMEQPDRVKIFQQFKQCQAGILFSTDVAARGLDLFKVDWILQFSCSAKPEDYVHRVGRTARIGTSGNALQFLLPSETKFLQLLQNHINVNFDEINLKETVKSLLSVKIERKATTLEEHVSHIQISIENAIYNDNDLLELAKKAYLSYVRSYASYPKNIREVLPFKDIHLGHVAKSFCLRESPRDLGAHGFNFKKSNESKAKRLEEKQEERNRKRKHFDMPLEFKVSEYDSGLDNNNPNKKFKAKKLN